jgi:hypothetical protein
MPPRTKLLVGVLAFLLLITAWVYLSPDDDESLVSGPHGAPPSLGAIPGSRSTPEKPAVERVEELRVADLTVQPHNDSPGRDPWRFVEPPPPPQPPPPRPHVPTAEELERMRQAQAELERRRQEELERQRAEALIPKPPPFTMTYVGSFGTPNRRIAVFFDGKETINALEGEVISGKFIVARIGYESVDIKFVGFPNTPAQRLAISRVAAGQ